MWEWRAVGASWPPFFVGQFQTSCRSGAAQGATAANASIHAIFKKVPSRAAMLLSDGWEPGSWARVESQMEEQRMSMITGRIAGKLIKVEDRSHWKNLELISCIVVGGPAVRFDEFESIAFMNCVFLYDGMEVEGREWLAFMSMERVRSVTRAPKRPH